jgi:DNA excision repair protein ERCC-3
MFGNGRARSGIIVLPCGAGKTFVGIAAACTIGRSTIVLCPNQTSVNQWGDQFARFSTVMPSRVLKLTAKEKPRLPPPSEAVVLLTTYSMIGSGGRSSESSFVLGQIKER